MNAGPLSTRLTLYRPVASDSSNGFSKRTTWEEAGTIAAERVRVNTKAMAENAEAWADYAPTFRIRLARRDLAEGWRIAERGDSPGRRYTITNIVTDRAFGMQTLSCERVNL